MKKTSIILAIIGIFTLSCTLPVKITFNPPTNQAKTDLALTVTAQALIISNANSATDGNVSTPTLLPTETTATIENTSVSLITATPSPVASATPNSSATPAKPMASVSIDTNCRTGPGQAYDIVGALLVGESAEVSGKNNSSNNLIIKNPDNPSTTCWLWGEHATVNGDPSALDEVSIPPTPTPLATATPTLLAPPNAPSNLQGSGSCDNPGGTGYHLHTVSGTITWKDNANNEQGFNIYTDYLHGDPPKLLGSVSANTTSYNFSAITMDDSFVLLVEGYNTSGPSPRASVNIPNNCHP